MLTAKVIVTFGIFSLQLAQAQLVQSLPKCVQNCINQSEDDNCSVTDIKCLCRASAGNFLPDLITCMHGNCDNDLDNNLLLTPLQFACEIAGTPIPDSAIQNAENVGSSLATQVTKTVTMGSGSSASATGGGFVATTTVVVQSPSVTTVTVTTTERDGSIIAIVYPVTEWHTTTLSGSGSTVTSISNDAATSTYTTTDSEGRTTTETSTFIGDVSGISTYTTTDSEGHTTTQISTVTETMIPSLAASSDSSDSTTIVTTSLAAAKTSSSSPSASKTSKAPSADETNSSPFKDEPSLAVERKVDNCLGLSIFLVLCILWL